MIRPIAFVLLLCAPAIAAVTGTVINQSTGTISAYSGIVAGGAATVVNDGTIAASPFVTQEGKGVDLEDGPAIFRR